VRANYLASPPLVSRTRWPRRMDVDLDHRAAGAHRDRRGRVPARRLAENAEINTVMTAAVSEEGVFRTRYADVFNGDGRWSSMEGCPPASATRGREVRVREAAAVFDGNCPSSRRRCATSSEPARWRCSRLGERTDHISPAGNIARSSPAAKYLMSKGVEPADLQTPTVPRRGNHE